MTTPTTVLVTGGAGYIGSNAVLALRDAGFAVVVIDNLSTGQAWLLPPDATLVQGDVGNPALLDRVMSQHKIDAVMHFAGSIVVPESVVRPIDYYKNNTVNSLTLIEACVRHGIGRFIFSSTAAVYGESASVPIFETTPANPTNPYGVSKLMTEWTLRSVAAAHDLRYVALRYFNVAGADLKGRSGQTLPQATHLIKVASQVALGLKPELAIFGVDYPTPDGTCIRDYIHVSDLATAHVQALRYLISGGDSVTLNCGYGRGSSVKEIIAGVERVLGRPLPKTEMPRRAGDVSVLVAATDRIRETLEWRPRHDDINLIISSALDWEKSLLERQKNTRC